MGNATPFETRCQVNWDETAHGLGSLLAPQLGFAGRIAGARVGVELISEDVGLTAWLV